MKFIIWKSGKCFSVSVKGTEKHGKKLTIVDNWKSAIRFISQYVIENNIKDFEVTTERNQS